MLASYKFYSKTLFYVRKIRPFKLHMAEFAEYQQRFRPSQPLTEMMDMNMEMLKHLPEMNPSILESFSITDFSADSLLARQQPEFTATYDHNNLSSTFHPDILSTATVVHTVTLNQNDSHDSKKRKSMEQSTSSYISPTASTNETKKKNVCICLFLEVFTICFLISALNF